MDAVETSDRPCVRRLSAPEDQWRGGGINERTTSPGSLVRDGAAFSSKRDPDDRKTVRVFSVSDFGRGYHIHRVPIRYLKNEFSPVTVYCILYLLLILFLYSVSVSVICKKRSDFRAEEFVCLADLLSHELSAFGQEVCVLHVFPSGGQSVFGFPS